MHSGTGRHGRVEDIQGVAYNGVGHLYPYSTDKAEFPRALFLVTGDATGANRSALTKGNINYYTVIQHTLELSNAQMRQPAINGSHADSYILCNSIMQNMAFGVDPSCEHLLYDIRNVQIEYKEEKMQIIKDRKDKTREADLADCLRYILGTFYGDFVRFNI